MEWWGQDNDKFTVDLNYQDVFSALFGGVVQEFVMKRIIFELFCHLVIPCCALYLLMVSTQKLLIL